MIPYRYALRRRVIQQSQSTLCELSITGTFYQNSDYNHKSKVIIGDLEYNSSTTLKLPKGTEVTVDIYNSGSVTVMFDGREVFPIKVGISHRYTFRLNASTKINVENNDPRNPATVTITTLA